MSELQPDPLQELRLLEQQLARATTVDELRPIFYRLEEISKRAGDNLDLQLGVGDLKQSLINRGYQIKGVPPPGPSAAPPPMPPPSAAGTPMVSSGMAPTAAYPKDWFKNLSANSPAAHNSSGIRQNPWPQEPQQQQPSAWTAPPKAPPGPPQPTAAKSPLGWILAVLTLLAVLAGGAYFFLFRPKMATIQIRTTPTGASILVDGQPRCTSNCEVVLTPGKHDVGVKLDGYAPALANVMVDANTQSSATVDVPLVPVAQSLRIHSDLGAGTITIDNDPPAVMKSEAFVREAITLGHHTVQVSAGAHEVKFSFDIVPGGLPSLSGTVSTKNALAIMVSSMGKHGRLATSSGPWKVNLNGAAESEAGPAGVELKAFRTGDNELVIGEGAEERRIGDTFSAAPALTVFLKQAKDAGTLTIATREDDVRVFINEHELPSRTAGGQLRVRLLGPVKVRVVKDGFDVPQPLMADIQRDQEVRMRFALTPKAASALAPAPVGAAAKPVSVRVNDEHPPLVTASDTKIPALTPPVASAPPPAATSTSSAPVSAAPVTPAPAPKQAAEAAAGSIEDFETPDAWRIENGVWRHHGQGFLVYKQPAQGVFTFEVQFIRGGHARWAVDYSDPRRYTLFELDDENLGVLSVTNGKRSNVAKIRHEARSKDHKWMMQIKVASGQVTHSVYRGQSWAVLDTRGAGKGRFGFLIQGNDEIALSSFRFSPL